MKTLEIGKDYGSIFGLDAKNKDQHLVYNGGNSWTMKEGAREQTVENGKYNEKVIDYINRPEIHMGR